MLKFLLFALMGIVGGVLGGMGMGGGTLLIPLLTIFLSVNQLSAQALNLISFIPMAVVALVVHAKNKLIKTKGLAFIIIPAAITAAAGSFISNGLSGELLKRIFGGFLIALSFVQFFSQKLAKIIENKLKTKY